MRQLSLLFLLVATLLVPRIDAQAQPETDLKRLNEQLRYGKADTSRVRVLLSISDWYQKKAQDQPDAFLDSVLVYARQAEIQSRSLGYKPLLGECLLAKSWKIRDLAASQPDLKKEQKAAAIEALSIYRATGDRLHWADANFLFARHTDSSSIERAHLQSSLKIYKELGDRPRMARTLMEMAWMDHPFGNYQEARRLGLEALALQEPVQDKETARTLYLLTIMSKNLGDFPHSLQFAHRHYQLARKLGDQRALRSSYMSLVSIYSELEDYEVAIRYSFAMLQIDLKRGRAALIVQTRLKLAGMLLTLNRNQEALNQIKAAEKLAETEAKAFTGNVLGTTGMYYLTIKDYPKAELWLAKTVAYYEKENSPAIAWSYVDLGILYLETKRLPQADSYLHKALQFARERGLPTKQREVVLQLYRLDSIRGNYQSALTYYRQYTTLNDSLINETKNKRIALLQVQFETEKKEQAIKLLQQEKKLDQISIRSAKTTRNVTIGGAVMLILLLGITYNRYRLKQRSNRQLEAKQIVIDQKNQSLQQVVGEKEALLRDKDVLLVEKEQLLDEREWMLKEIHHRVKNNLQIISSMLNSQFSFLHDPTALAALRESQNRVQIMALIHQKLYQSESLTLINMQEYIHEIVDYLIESFDRFSTVHPKLDIADAHLDVSLATPLGLIINEVVTNSLKYAFPQNRPGRLSIGFTSLDSQTYQLTMSDDGIGLPANFDFERSNTLGMTMIRGLSKQIKGQLSITQNNGVQISLQFSVAKKPVKTVLQSA